MSYHVGNNTIVEHVDLSRCHILDQAIATGNQGATLWKTRVR
jgi:hypothetical protein